MDRLRELLGLDADEKPEIDLAERSINDLTADRDAVRAALQDREGLSVSDVKAIVSFGQQVKDELEARSALDADIEALTAEPKAEAKPDAKVGDVKRPADNSPTPEPKADEPEEEEEETPVEVLVAAGGPKGPIPDGAALLTSAEALGQAMLGAWRGTGAPSSGSVRHRVAHKRWTNEFLIDSENAKQGEDYRVIRAAFDAAQRRARSQLYDGEVIQAASGICGPLEPRYSFLQLASGTSGLIDLPDVTAARGGLRLPQAITAYDLRAEEGIADEYTSADGSAGVTKQTYTVACPTVSDFNIVAYQTNARFSNFQGQFFPEYVSHVTDVTLAQHAHVVNEALIDAIIASADTLVYQANGATKLGDAWAQFTRQASFHAWLYRDKYKTSQDLVLDQIWAYRALGALIADVMARDSSRPEAAAFGVAAAVAAFGREIGVRFQFPYDYQNMVDTPGDFGSEEYEFLTFPAGEVLHMTAATLEFGPVRDSTRNSANEFDMWTETFDGIATAGYEIMRTTEVLLCPNGATGARVTIDCGTGS